ncbi:putative cell viability protein [Papiliotrema laurentii]|uniref:NADH dehydrogenase [ubiquinone] 1 alpha subcomplex subunit n=1 Tax=Papiliotrema laurentii TaxID=5418 RepID=A0AAD9FVM6_PAPLA|nr:putative cell viability protein [Papiliotrema laurentii]
MVSIGRYIRNLRQVGWKEYYRQMWYIGDAKAGTLVGTDQFGNRYYENTKYGEEVPGRHRWVDFAQHDYNASQVPPEWHSWINHIRKDAPPNDPIMQASSPPWKTPYVENLTGTRGRYMTYSTTAPKIGSWEPVVAQRGAKTPTSS